MSQEIFDDLINDFQVDKFTRFFREKNRAFAPRKEDLIQYNDDNFRNGIKLGEIKFAQDEKMLICAFEANQPLSERSGKKAQYEKGKKILKDSQSDAGIFIFYNPQGNFRFSLIYANYLGKKRDWSVFRRFTYFVSKEYTNKTFLQQIGEEDFSSLEKIKDAFSVEKVTKEFYTEIANWYFWAVQNAQFLKDAEKEENGRNISVIRLITRMIFIWFIRQKQIIPDVLFNKNLLKNIAKDFCRNNKSANYYNAILQNLFFGTLNQKLDERGFVKEGSFQENKNEYGVKNLFRYADKFTINEKEVIGLFKDIPFLNGGLFDCLDKPDEQGKIIYIDGFSRNTSKQARIPDYLFFQENETSVDLSSLGLGRNQEVKGLFEILNNYNFTIDENTPIDQEVALDPELLGKVFENLLASYNPETATTARKATGSYYTPREIVDYMVDESLTAYLSTTLERHSRALSCHSREGGNPEVVNAVIASGAKQSKSQSEIASDSENPRNDAESRLRHLLSYTDETHMFSELERKKIIAAINNIKILDPACGSGAFPMGMLHKLVYILHKLDADNKEWYEIQYQKAIAETEEAFRIGSKEEREQRLKEINDIFDQNINEPDYARKLYLIENCIYGVDIQPIAVQISKLRFFISLVIDQKVDKSKPNYGILSLPNLETKFTAANTLIGLEKPEQLAFRSPAVLDLEKKITLIRHKYFEAKTWGQKSKCQRDDKKLRRQLAETLKHEGWLPSTADRIVQFDPYDQNTSADWFDPEWMFGIQSPSPLAGEGKGEGGFDIVIGNPPYVRHESIKALKPQLASEFDSFYCGTADLYTYFYKKGIDLLKERGHLCFIAPNKFMRAGYGRNTRTLLAKEATPKIVIDFCDLPIFDATTYPAVILVEKGASVLKVKGVHIVSPLQQPVFLAATFTDAAQLERLEETLSSIGFKMPVFALKEEGWNLEMPEVLALMEKLRKAGKPLGEYVQGRFYRGITTGLNNAFVIDNETKNQLISKHPSSVKLLKPLLRGKDVKRWKANFIDYYLIKIESSENVQHPWSGKPLAEAEKLFKKEYPAIYDRFEKFREKLIKRDDKGKYFWELRSCAYWNEFTQPKIILGRFMNKATFAFDKTALYHNDALYMIAGSNEYVVAILNSTVAWWFLTQTCTDLQNGYLQAFRENLFQVPIPHANPKSQRTIIEHVQTILSNHNGIEVPHLETEINKLVYTLYGLTPEEIEIVEGKSRKKAAMIL